MSLVRTRVAAGFLAAAGLALGGAFLAAALDGAEAEVSKVLTLDNGLKVFLLERRGLPLVNIAAAVNCGSKDETTATSGLAHLLEHYCLVRGTSVRSGEEIGRQVRSRGAYFNARTGQDLMLFEMSLPSSYVDFGLSNQKEILFDLKITPAEVEAERVVVLEELNLIADDPVKAATSLVFQKVFASHPYGNPLQGTPEGLKSLTPSVIEDFYRSFFVPANASLAVVGDFDLPEMEQKVRSVFGGLPAAAFKPRQIPAAPALAKDIDLTLEMDVTKATSLIGMAGPDYDSPDQYAADALAEVLGRGFNPMLNSALRGSRDLVETVSMSYSALKHGGLILVNMGLNPKNLAAANREALKFLRSARSLNFSPDDILGEEQFYAFDYLQSAKNQIKFQMYSGQERGLNVASSLARYLLLWDGGAERNFLRSIEKLSSSDLRHAAGKYLGGGKKVVVSIVPRKKGKGQ
jgi:zinc protease